MPRAIKRPLSVHGPTAPERKWKRILKRWRKSGEEGRAFCRRHGLRESAFRFWLREIPERAQRRKARKRPLRLLPTRHRPIPGRAPSRPAPEPRCRLQPVGKFFRKPPDPELPSCADHHSN